MPAGFFFFEDGNTVRPTESKVNKYNGYRENECMSKTGEMWFGLRSPKTRHTLDKHIFNAMTVTTRGI